MKNKSTRPDLQCGDRVKIIGGPFEGQDGYIHRVVYNEFDDDYFVEVKVKVSWSDDPISVPMKTEWVRLHY